VPKLPATHAAVPAHPIEPAAGASHPAALLLLVWPYAVATGAVAASSALSYILSNWLAPGSLDLVFLTGVLLVAMSQGLWPSLFCSVLSYLAYSYGFVQPLHSFHIDSTQDWLDLAAFMTAAMITGTLAATVRSQLALIRKTAQQNHQLYDFTRGIASAITRGELAALVREHVSATLRCRTCMLFPGAHNRLEFTDDHALSAADEAAAQLCHEELGAPGRRTQLRGDGAWTFVALASQRQALGVLGVQLPSVGTLQDQNLNHLLLAMRDQTVVALERIDLAARMEQTQLLKETERLREALLSSVSHDLRTPLASIIGAATTLRDLGSELRDSQRLDLLDTVIDESSRLNRFVQNLLDMTRIGYGALKPRAAWADLREIAGPAIRSLANAHPGHRVTVETGDNLPQVWTDAVLLERVLFNVLDNAAKYAPASAPITLAIHCEQSQIIVSVDDCGPGIPPDEHEQVFDMFHRVQRGDSAAAGTGMGLAICRGLMQALGGNIRAQAGAAGGTRMILTLPITTELP
jgi:two-component system sensor histidine kinase KdpD